MAWVLRESEVPHRIASSLDAEAIRGALTELLRDNGPRVAADRTPIQTRFTRERLAGELAAVLDSACEAVPTTNGEQSLMKVSDESNHPAPTGRRTIWGSLKRLCGRSSEFTCPSGRSAGRFFRCFIAFMSGYARAGSGC